MTKKTTKPKKKPAVVKKLASKTNTFYMYKWENGFTTFVVAGSEEEAIAKIKKNRTAACPPELQDEKLSKKRVSKAHPDFILTVGGPSENDMDLEGEESEKSLN